MKSLITAGRCLFILTLLCLWCCGCAVTEPTDLDRARIASAIQAEPTRSIESLCRELGVSELAVVKALPADQARVWPDEPEAAWEAIRAWDVARFEVGTPPFQVNHTGPPGEVRFLSPDDYHQMSSRFPVEIVADWHEISEVWLLRKPRPGGELHAVWFFDEDGAAVLRVAVSEPADRSGQQHFDAIWNRVSP